MKRNIICFVCALLFASCNQESVELNGNIKGIADMDSHLLVKMKSISNQNERILDSIDLNKGMFIFTSKDIKPPFKLTFMMADSCEFDVWVGEYGNKTLEIDLTEGYKINLLGSFFCDELLRVQGTYDKMYLAPIKSKLTNLSKLNKEIKAGKVLDSDEEELKNELEEVKKKAYRLRKKSILKTVRKNPNNPVSMGLMFEEFERLTSWQKKEAKKYMSKYFSDTGLNWQMKN